MTWRIGDLASLDHITVTYRILADVGVGDWRTVSEDGYRPAEYKTEKEGRAALERFNRESRNWPLPPYRLHLVVISVAQVTVDDVEIR